MHPRHRFGTRERRPDSEHRPIIHSVESNQEHRLEMGNMKRILGILALTLLAVLGVAPAAQSATAATDTATATDIVVEDNANVLYRPQLLAELGKIKFYEPTTVAIYTVAGIPGSDKLNADVLQFARAKHPEWLSADGQKWADGLFIFALDPTARKVGTYFGEDRKVSAGKRDAIQEAGKDLFREAQWTDGTLAGIKKGAALINQPWYRSAAFIATFAITAGAALLGLGTWFGMRAFNRGKARGHLTRGDTSFASVSMDLDVTELNAKTIPANSSYGSQVLERYRNFSSKYGQAGVLNRQVHTFTGKDLSKAANVKVVAQYADTAVELDGLDDVIADTNTLLNKFSGWEAAWDRQVQPLRDDLAGLPAVVGRKEAGGLAESKALASFGTQAEGNLRLWAAQIGDGLLTPEAALDELKSARDELGSLLTGLSDALIREYANTSKEADAMRSTMRTERNTAGGYGRPNILGTVFGMHMFYTVTAFDHSYASARSSVDSSRSSSSGGSTGYGSSGGSFSGSGSSSSF